MQTAMSKLGCLTIAAALMGGCAAKAKTGAARASDKNAPTAKTRFETEREPAITAQTRYAAGQLAESQGNPAVAIKQYEEALRLKSDHVPSLYRLGVVQAQVKQYPKAIETWKRYLKTTHDSANGYGNLGFCYELSGDAQAAEAAYLKGIAKDPKSQPCRVNYGLMLARQDRMTDAITQLRAVLTAAEVSYNIGSVHEMKGRREQAKVEYQRALEMDPDFADAQARLAALE
jgi:tetratricopeptide (TPR) repeat protein